ncbi:MAG: hypothetical protein ACKO40_06430 [Planctomycetaceae bacterium]
MTQRKGESLHTLLSAVVDATASEEQVAELTRLLQSDAEARRFYVRYVDMHAALTGGQFSRGAARARRAPWGIIVASLIAASLLVAWLVAPSRRRENEGDRPRAVEIVQAGAAPARYVVTIASASPDATLDGEAVVSGSRLTPGPYKLTTGAVNLRFDGGARIFLQGAARFAIQSRRAIKIDEGTFVFRGDQTCESIEVVTPHSVFRNIGTRYAAVIDARREEVHVAEGAVRRTAGDRASSQRHELIEAGEGRRYRVAMTGVESIPLDGELVARSLEGATAEPSSGPPSVMDDFRGGAGQIQGLKSGTGWAEPWDSRRGGLRVAAPGLSGGGSVAVVHEAAGKESARWKSAAHRRLETPIDLATDGIWYVRFLVRRGPLAARDEHRAMVVLRAHGKTAEEELDQNAFMQIALRKHDGVLLRVADTLTRASLPQTSGQTYAVVAKIVAGRSRPDQVLLSLMAAERLAGSAEPAEWSVVSEDVDSDLRFETLSLEFSSGGRIMIGDICIGPTWASVAQPFDR